MNDSLKRSQDAAQEAEKKMMDFLMQYEPAQELAVCHVKQIAAYTLRLVFDAIETVKR